MISCPPRGEDLLWGFHELLKESQMDSSGSSRVLDEILCLLHPVVCPELLQRSWKAFGRAMWFPVRAQLGNSGVFCSSGALWDTGVIALQSSFHLMIMVIAAYGPRTEGVVCVVARKGGGKGSAVPPSFIFPSAVFTPALRELDLQLSSSCPHPPWMDEPPTRPSCCPLQKRPSGWQQWRLGAGDESVGMTECSVLLIHQVLLWSCLDKHREKYNQISTKFQNLLHFY